MERPDAIFFDLDGTIVDSRWPYSHSLNAALERNQQQTYAPEALYKYLGPPIRDTLKDLAIPAELTEQIIRDYRAIYSSLGSQGSLVFDGMRELLTALSGQLPLLVATSKAAMLAQPLLEDLGLDGCFEQIVGPGAAETNEPKSVTIGRALALLDGRISHSATGKPNVVMVGDRLYDVEGARTHGIATVGVLWGIGDAVELTSAGAAALIEHPSELPPLLSL
jgi:phosphoglycolate phosphatase